MSLGLQNTAWKFILTEKIIMIKNKTRLSMWELAVRGDIKKPLAPQGRDGDPSGDLEQSFSKHIPY